MTPHSGMDSLEVVVDVIKYKIMIPELKTLCHYYFDINTTKMF